MVKPKTPTPANLSPTENLVIGVMAIIQIILWMSMILAGANVLFFWMYTILTKGIIDQLTVQYSIIIAVGAYFCLIIDKDKIYETLKIKRELPFISNKNRTVR